MSQFNTLLHGEAREAADILGSDNPPDTHDELRAALTNALNRITRLEAVHDHMRGIASLYSR